MSNLTELLQQAQQLEEGQEKVALLEEVVRQCDLHGEEKQGYEVRKRLIRSAIFCGQGEKTLPAFAWCQHYLDKNLAELGQYEALHLAWMQKWILNTVLHFPQIPSDRLKALYADFTQRAQALGANGGTAARYELAFASHAGDREAASEAFERWQTAGRDRLSDCSACEAQAVADFHNFMGDDASCVRESQRIIERGFRCAEIPHCTYASVLIPLLRLGQWNQAAEYARKGRRMVAGKSGFVLQQAQHLEYLALTDHTAALRWYVRHLPWAEQSQELGDRFNFHAASALLFKVLSGGKGTRKLQLPPGVYGYQESGVYNVSERQDNHQSQAQQIASQFDARNGTVFYTQSLARILALSSLKPEVSI